MLNDAQLKKKAVFFGLDNVLVPGEVDSKVNAKEVEKILKNLRELQKNCKNFFWGIVSGYTKEKGLEKLKKHGLEK
ncbi:MAG: hypothetical protein PHD95_07115, partial [Candidatus ainarchaeum sp.]|nr:hypothetical protein [Candidatus ainarchaeum sp.]